MEIEYVMKIVSPGDKIKNNHYYNILKMNNNNHNLTENDLI